jgi:hypothetical protein
MAVLTNPHKYVALTGDVISLGIVTLIGFSTHGTLATAGTRVFSTFLPLVLSWFLITPFFTLYDPQVILDARQLWRPLYAMAFAVPLAAWMRGLWLGSPIQPVFVAVLFAAGGFAMGAWRALFWGILNLKRRIYG